MTGQMQDSTAVEDQAPAEGTAGTNGARPARDSGVGRALLFVGFAAVSAAVAYVLIRAVMNRPHTDDPTAERIQSLIEEANRLLKELDEKKSS